MWRGLAVLLVAGPSALAPPLPWPAVTRGFSALYAETDAGFPWAVLSAGAPVLVTEL